MWLLWCCLLLAVAVAVRVTALLLAVTEVDDIVQPVRGTGWQTSHPGDRRVRRELRQTLKRCGLPIKGDLFDHAYAYIRENY